MASPRARSGRGQAVRIMTGATDARGRGRDRPGRGHRRRHRDGGDPGRCPGRDARSGPPARTSSRARSSCTLGHGRSTRGGWPCWRRPATPTALVAPAAAGGRRVHRRRARRRRANRCEPGQIHDSNSVHARAPPSSRAARSPSPPGRHWSTTTGRGAVGALDGPRRRRRRDRHERRGERWAPTTSVKECPARPRRRLRPGGDAAGQAAGLRRSSDDRNVPALRAARQPGLVLRVVRGVRPAGPATADGPRPRAADDACAPRLEHAPLLAARPSAGRARRGRRRPRRGGEPTRSGARRRTSLGRPGARQRASSSCPPRTTRVEAGDVVRHVAPRRTWGRMTS